MSSIVELPLRVAGRAAGLALKPLRAAGSVAERMTGRGGQPAPPAPPEARPTPTPAPSRPRPAPTRPAATDPAPPAAPAESLTDGPAAGAAFAPAPPEPTPGEVGQQRLRRREEARTDDSPGAQVHVDEPWDGYKEMTAPDIVDRLQVMDDAARAVVLLYEQTHKARKTVVEAAGGKP